MQIKFCGAVRTVTGSQHLLTVNGHKILLDCGLYQGSRKQTYERNQHLPYDAASIDVLVLSHAHIDHSGNIPNLVKQGFTGNIWCTAATRNLCTYMLMDSGYIQEQDVAYLNKKRRKRGKLLVDPIYTRQDAQESLSQVVGIGLHRKIIVADGVELTFYDAGHILGAAHVCLDIHDRDAMRSIRLVFSGDIGRDETAILNAPEPIREADVVLMESTYGDRLHGTYEGARRKLRDVVNRDDVRVVSELTHCLGLALALIKTEGLDDASRVRVERDLATEARVAREVDALLGALAEQTVDLDLAAVMGTHDLQSYEANDDSFTLEGAPFEEGTEVGGSVPRLAGDLLEADDGSFVTLY